MAQHHELSGTPENMVWGYFDSTTKPVLEIESGDTVTIHAVPAGGKRFLPTDGRPVPQNYLDVLDKLVMGPGPHIVSGPVYVKGAVAGDVLQVDILDVTINMDWGFVCILPLLGTLPEEFTDYEIVHGTIDHARNVCVMPWGTEVPLDPFFGIMGVAPPAVWGRVGSTVPRAFGGNMDNKELKAGSTLYLPVFNDGALFFAGDGHGVQGDGEVTVSALETGLSGRFRLTVRKDMALDQPFGETPTHLVSIGLHEDLDDAAKQAVREMVKHVCARTKLTRNQAYMLCSLAGNLRVTQLVDVNKGVHMMLAKDLL
jgi:acetamidase/formamidase